MMAKAPFIRLIDDDPVRLGAIVAGVI